MKQPSEWAWQRASDLPVSYACGDEEEAVARALDRVRMETLEEAAKAVEARPGEYNSLEAADAIRALSQN